MQKVFTPFDQGDGLSFRLAGKLNDNFGLVLQGTSPHSIASNYTFRDTDTIDSLQVDATTGNITVTLPSPTGARRRRVIKIDSSANTVTISGTINGLSSYTLSSQYDFVEVEPTGAAWLIINWGSANVTIPGNVGIGTSPVAYNAIRIGGSATGATTVTTVNNIREIQSDVTSGYNGFSSFPSTAAASFTITSLRHFSALQGTLGAGSAITSQIAFNADSSLSGAATNIAFRGQIGAASNNYNLYMDGTAQNYLAGELGIGVAPSSTTQLVLAASTTGKSSLRLPHGAAPSSPIDGDMWTTTAGLYVRINGATVGPLT